MSTSSAYSTRFLTNREFSDQEKTCVQELLLQTTDELQDVGEQIAQLSRQIARLTCREAELKSDISHYKVALAPHKMLPEYILRLILQWCIPPGGLLVPESRSRKPWPSFTRVCSSWRKLAMNTPELWRDVAVRLHYDRCDAGCIYIINLAHKWLSHAGNMPRSLKIKAWGSDRNCSEALDRLVVAFRFRCLDLTLTRDQFQRVLSLPPQTQSLDSLHLMVAGDSFLRVVYEDCSAYNLITTLPWGQLRDLRINSASISASTLINALSNCLVLEELRMIVSSDPTPCDVPASFITLPNLLRLTLSFVTGSNPEIFFRSLILPQVEELDMGMTDSRTEMPGCTSLHFANMAERSGMSRIRDLFLGKGVKPYRLVDLLKYTPSLSCLYLGGDVVFDNQTLEDMSTGQLGPNMTALYLPDLEDSSRILEMVWTRFQNASSSKDEKSVTPIRYVQVSGPRIADDDNGWVNKLRGLRIHCSVRGSYH